MGPTCQSLPSLHLPPMWRAIGGLSRTRAMAKEGAAPPRGHHPPVPPRSRHRSACFSFSACCLRYSNSCVIEWEKADAITRRSSAEIPEVWRLEDTPARELNGRVGRIGRRQFYPADAVYLMHMHALTAGGSTRLNRQTRVHQQWDACLCYYIATSNTPMLMLRR